MKYKRIVRAMQRTPWAILPHRLAEIWAVIESRELDLDKPEAEAIATKNAVRQPRIEGDTAIIPIIGTIAPRMNLLLAMSGGVSAEILRAQIQQAAEDDEVKAILLDINSPGGSVYGVPEAAEAIFEARSQKPVVAMVNPVAASAAYWLASQASEIVTTPSGEVGSIGVFVLHQDFSEAFESEGIKNTIIKSSPNKAEANAFEPLSDDDRDELQRVINLIDTDFHRAIARGRGLSLSSVRSDFGQGRMVLAKEALDKRMIDKIDTPDRTLRRLESPQARGRIGKRARLTVRELEAELRNFGFSQNEARTIASSADEILEPRDEASQGPRDEVPTDAVPRDEAAVDLQAALRTALQEIRDSI